MTKSYEKLPKIVKLILQFFLGWPISCFYRIIKFFEKNNFTTLIAGLLCIPFGIIFWIVDFVTELTNNRITVLAK